MFMENSYILTCYCNITLIPLIFRRQLLKTGSEGLIKSPVTNAMLLLICAHLCSNYLRKVIPVPIKFLFYYKKKKILLNFNFL